MKPISFILFAGALLLYSPESFSQDDTTWVKNNTWYFDNFDDPELPWSLFRETFIGVAPSPSGDFDQLFYDYLYKTELAKSGHCFGMCVLALLLKKNGGYLGFCYPPYTYSGTISSIDPDIIGPADPNLQTAIAMVHGNQINHGFLLFLLDVITMAKNRDGRYAFDRVNYYLSKDDPPVISVTKNLSPAGGGHVLIPYDTRIVSGEKRIYVYDPNHSFYEPGANGHDYYVNHENYIAINETTGEWSFNKTYASNPTPDIWTGRPSSGLGGDLGSGGNCIVIPLSIAGKKDRLPQSLFADIAEALNKIFIFATN